MSDPGGSWTLLTGHGHVLVEIARDPEARIRDISTAVGLTERTVQAIVADLEAAGYLARTRNGRRTKYTVNRDSLFRHSAQEGLRVGPLLDLLVTEDTEDTAAQDLAAQDGAAGKAGKAGKAGEDDAAGVREEATTARHRPTLRRRRR
jgi:DNA-binding MarR family transcriptional regulator